MTMLDDLLLLHADAEITTEELVTESLTWTTIHRDEPDGPSEELDHSCIEDHKENTIEDDHIPTNITSPPSILLDDFTQIVDTSKHSAILLREEVAMDDDNFYHLDNHENAKKRQKLSHRSTIDHEDKSTLATTIRDHTFATVQNHFTPAQRSLVQTMDIQWTLLPESIVQSDLARMVVQTLQALGGTGTTNDILQRFAVQTQDEKTKKRIAAILSHKNHADFFFKNMIPSKKGKSIALWHLNVHNCTVLA
ncbi:hypothetical protein PROFUN_02539 [Planoprotostelium fungivorum]|uniref:Uncharacterized protein n=1 Tax=Planoprotostelium fungivorum TaxID=1890364 RepID=A0A2P6MP94_9EUKA|nr:hypothetical protein PROFUN_02539 [Planoprotostelium fungivorum]